MESNTSKSSSSNTSKIIIGILLFSYFGWIIFPGKSFFVFLLWLFSLPVVISALVITGVRGGSALWRAKYQKAIPDPQNKYFVWLASLGILWLFISIALAETTQYAYVHKKFDSETWKNTNWEDGDPSPRDRMVNDLMNNILPGRTKTEIIEILGQPDDIRNDGGEETLYYYTGVSLMEPECLFMKFDKREIIKKYALSVCG